MPTTIKQKEPICALATPAGKGALSIVRLSGKGAQAIAEKVTQKKLPVRHASFTSFYTQNGDALDQGLVIYFQAPASFTGEDVVEFHCHGNPLLADLLLKTLCGFGARLASPGEFSLRAFLNSKIDLAQAEAIADLINSTTEQSARTATKSLQGEFSKRVANVLAQLIQLRMHIEAHLDFPDEEIEPQQSQQLTTQIQNLELKLSELLQQAKLGERLQTGATVAIAGKPNAGKSSLLNVLAQSEVAIVTEIPGTTRDPLTADIELQGIAVRMIDTAGLRKTQDIVEAKGIERAQQALSHADVVLWLRDIVKDTEEPLPEYVDASKVIYVHNKTDLQNHTTLKQDAENIFISAKTGSGIDNLINLLAARIKGTNTFEESAETPFLARNRHVVALKKAQENLTVSQQHINHNLELAAEELRVAQRHLGEITGEFTPDDLLGKIFSEFCIGK